MKNLQYVIFIIFIVLFSCKQKEILPPNEKPEIDYKLIDSIENELLKAYSDTNFKALEDLFLGFCEKQKPIDTSLIKSQIEKDIYNIFHLVYKPNKLDFLSDSIFNPKHYKNTDYYIIQSKVKYFLEDGVKREIWYDSMPAIWNFKPKLKFKNNKKYFYLTPEIDSAINRFLDFQDYPVGEGNLMNPALPRQETEKRFNFIYKLAKIKYGHWGGYWHLETHPEISVIQFTQKRNYAYVSYRIQYTFWIAEVYKKNGEWIIMKIKQNGAE
ncbi:hypothetical protein [Labilibacter marinus]|uniref:hypothetical protein n=1 Tax=Labilibacter marinus TaxID=1477105 RepID=UPI000830AC0F|nr:hypothetical protein [Labilibacter marinus]